MSPISPLSHLSRYVYGTTRLGDESIPRTELVDIARTAIDSGLWIHTSHQYGQALSVLREAFDQNRSQLPSTIFKIGWSSAEEVRGQISEQLAALDIPSMSIGQLCPGGPLAEALCNGGEEVDRLRGMKEEGLVGGFVMEVWPWTSDVALRILKNGHAEGLIEALIYYLNPLQRFVTNELWDVLNVEKFEMIAMRTVCGGDPYRLRDSDESPTYLRDRAASVIPIFERSGAASWTEFSVRFGLGLERVKASVGSTSHKANLQAFIASAESCPKLPQDVVDDILELQRIWSDQHDRTAAPWSM